PRAAGPPTRAAPAHRPPARRLMTRRCPPAAWPRCSARTPSRCASAASSRRPRRARPARRIRPPPATASPSRSTPCCSTRRAAPPAAPGAAAARPVARGTAPPLARGRLVFVPGVEQPRDDRRRVRGFAREHGLPLGFAAGRGGWPAVVAADEGLLGSRDLVGG